MTRILAAALALALATPAAWAQQIRPLDTVLSTGNIDAAGLDDDDVVVGVPPAGSSVPLAALGLGAGGTAALLGLGAIGLIAVLSNDDDDAVAPPAGPIGTN